MVEREPPVVRDRVAAGVAGVGARWFGGVRGFVVRHPRWVDGALAAGVGLVNADRALAGAGAAGVAFYVAVHLLLVWRRAAPVLVCWAVLGLAVLGLVVVGVRVEGLHPEAVIAIGVYTVARHAALRRLVPVVVVVGSLALTASFSAGPRWTAVGFVTFGLTAAVLLGLVVRTRRAYLAELEDRARRLERDRDQRAEIAVAAERARIARDMHDIVAHHLSVMVTLADAATLTAASSPGEAVTAMRHVSGTGRQALGEMRRVLGLLHEDSRAAAAAGMGSAGDVAASPQPGLADLDALVAGVRAAGLRVEVTTEGVPGRLGPGAELAVYRIVQEALTNVLKHAGAASRSGVRVRYTGDRVELEVTDDGTSAPPGGGGQGGGRGMTGMAARAAAYGGRFAAGPRTDAPGWSVRATLHGDPASDAPASSGPTSDGPASDGPASDGPASGGPPSDHTANGGQASGRPASDGRATNGPASDGPAEDSLAEDSPAQEGTASGVVRGAAGRGGGGGGA
ncbi:histidine kinase [Dactylosporangium sp. NPDC049742]|uniref:sensor histidine kinase n=1 Tax=Dactylosporangium sp. NPDC049742 TaxID=3154737 RepID=UPI0034366990